MPSFYDDCWKTGILTLQDLILFKRDNSGNTSYIIKESKVNLFHWYPRSNFRILAIE